MGSPRKTSFSGIDMIEKGNLVKNLQSLIRIPSFMDSTAVSKWIKNELEGLGYEVWSDSDGNLIAETGKGPGFILNAHMDTVEAGDGWKHDPFGGEIENERIYGRGASDCKAGIASMLEIARYFKKNPPERRVVFTFTAYEEGYPLEKNGLYKILPKLKNIEKGLILEPTTKGSKIGIAFGCRGSMRYRLEINGRKGHSAYLPHSANPIYLLPGFLGALSSAPSRKLKIPSIGAEIEDANTVTEVRAHEGRNVVPSKCVVSIDRRALPDELPEEYYETLKSICRKSLGTRFMLRQVSGMQGYLFEDRDFIDMCSDAVKSAGFMPEPRFEMARIDGCILYNFAKIGTFMMGPGDIGQAHQLDEYCEIEGLVKATEAVLNVILFNHE